MTNWCENKIEVSHSDPSMIAKFARGFSSGDPLQIFLSSVDDVVLSWGVCDCSAGIISDDGLTFTAFFNSAGYAPSAGYADLVDIGFKVNALWYEPVSKFYGSFVTYDEDNDLLYSISSRQYYSFNDIPKEYLEPFDINEEFY